MSNLVIAAVRAALTQNASVTALVPASSITSAYRLDVGTLPAIVLTVQADEAVSPAIDRTDCLRRIAVAVECIAGSLADSRTIGETVRIAMHGAKGTAFSTQVQEIRESGITTTYDVGEIGRAHV